MPQCQRSPNNTVLQREAFELTPGIVRCPGEPYSPGCPGTELYIIVATGPLREYLDGSLSSCAERFGVQRDELPTDLWLGESPLTVLETSDRWAIYLGRASDGLQLRRQIAHEAFHRVCGPGGAGHWTHEMLAEVFTMYRLTETADVQYAMQSIQEARQRASGVSMSELHAWTGGGEFYGKALAVGLELLDACGWEHVARLVDYFDHDWRPDPERWLRALPSHLMAPASSILGL